MGRYRRIFKRSGAINPQIFRRNGKTGPPHGGGKMLANPGAHVYINDDRFFTGGYIMFKRLFFAALFFASAALAAEPGAGKTEWKQNIGAYRVTMNTNCPDARAKVGDTVMIRMLTVSPTLARASGQLVFIVTR